jgi:hypothetical protein
VGHHAQSVLSPPTRITGRWFGLMDQLQEHPVKRRGIGPGVRLDRPVLERQAQESRVDRGRLCRSADRQRVVWRPGRLGVEVRHVDRAREHRQDDHAGHQATDPAPPSVPACDRSQLLGIVSSAALAAGSVNV